MNEEQFKRASTLRGKIKTKRIELETYKKNVERAIDSAKEGGKLEVGVEVTQVRCKRCDIDSIDYTFTDKDFEVIKNYSENRVYKQLLPMLKLSYSELEQLYGNRIKKLENEYNQLLEEYKSI